ncbi:ATP-binding protein [Streptomyces sp. TS71-3]|uniref:ATP-binding protein n=1 Tax=Streptomyces sp. TS71-3 TaxID=2733862 RepID=UPI001B2A0071|nr:ATP-binding protein [Streptomyces sp. TS71-3]GHJ39585.1 ATPase [Streptomyces sp. TS71-3]
MSTTRPGSGDSGPEPGAEGATASRHTYSAPGAAVPTDPGPAASAPSSAAGIVDTPDAGDRLDARGRRTRRLSFRDATGIVPLARDFTRQALRAWGWLPASGADQRAAAEDVLLVVSELVTNACLHAEGPEELWLGCDRKVLRIEVSDRGAGQPAPRTPHRAGRPGGHGMFIVQRLCLDWGVIRTPGLPGKTVWAELGSP